MKRLSLDQLNRGEFDSLRIKRTRLLAPATSNIEVTLPSVDGTLALTSYLSSYVDLVSNQSIGGIKTFTDNITAKYSASNPALTPSLNFASFTNCGIFFKSGINDKHTGISVDGVEVAAFGKNPSAGAYARFTNVNGASIMELSTDSAIAPGGRINLFSPGNASGVHQIVSNASTFRQFILPDVGGTAALTSNTVDLTTNQIVQGTKTFVNTPSLGDGSGARYFRIAPDPNNIAGTNSLNFRSFAATPGLTHTLQFGTSGAPVGANTTWSLDPNGGFIPNTSNSQTIVGMWNFTSSAASTTTAPVSGGSVGWRPAGNTPLTGANPYYWVYFGIPPTTGSGTSGNIATFTLAGPPVNGPGNGADTGQNTDTIRVETGSIRASTGAIIAGNGTLAVPSIRMGSTASDLSTGFYRPAANQIGVVSNGSTIMTIKNTATHVAITGNATVSGGMAIGTGGTFMQTVLVGQASVGPVAINSGNGVFGNIVNYGTTFGSIPRVFLTVDYRNFTNGYALTAILQDETTSGFTFALVNNSAINVPFPGGGFIINWMAIRQ